MMHELLERLQAQHDCVAVWQLRAAGWTRSQVGCRLPAGGLRPVRGLDGVWTSSRGILAPAPALVGSHPDRARHGLPPVAADQPAEMSPRNPGFARQLRISPCWHVGRIEVSHMVVPSAIA